MMIVSPLLASIMRSCVILDTVTRPDGFGGYDEVYTDGAEIMAAITLKSSTEAQIAYQTGIKRLYVVVTEDAVKLKQGMRIRRVQDNLTLRITSNASDFTAPQMAGVKMAQVTAEAIEA